MGGRGGQRVFGHAAASEDATRGGCSVAGHHGLPSQQEGAAALLDRATLTSSHVTLELATMELHGAAALLDRTAFATRDVPLKNALAHAYIAAAEQQCAGISESGVVPERTTVQQRAAALYRERAAATLCKIVGEGRVPCPEDTGSEHKGTAVGCALRRARAVEDDVDEVNGEPIARRRHKHAPMKPHALERQRRRAFLDSDNGRARTRAFDRDVAVANKPHLAGKGLRAEGDGCAAKAVRARLEPQCKWCAVSAIVIDIL